MLTQIRMENSRLNLGYFNIDQHDGRPHLRGNAACNAAITAARRGF